MSLPQNAFLGATKLQGEIDVPVTSVELEQRVSAGIYLEALSAGLVPVYEEHLARLERGIGLEQWAQMSVDEKALVIAVRRTTNAIQNIQTEAEIEHSKKMAKQK